MSPARACKGARKEGVWAGGAMPFAALERVEEGAVEGGTAGLPRLGAG